MKKILGIIGLSLLWCNVAQAATAFATCSDGQCEFTNNLVYDWAKVSCKQTFLSEFVIIESSYFMIVNNEKICNISEGGNN
tara:strand:- start:218 stop:460 length:243 start_codon:yes stop_codon:yes gene_type:complete